MNPIGMMMPLSLTGGAGGAAGPASGASNNGFADNFGTPFNFDNSGWITNLHSAGNTNGATGNTGANQASQAASATPTQIAPTNSAPTLGNTLMGSMGNNMLPMMLGGALILVLLIKRV